MVSLLFYGLKSTSTASHTWKGPVIRVSPEEIHISDPLFYHKLFVPFNIRRTYAYTKYALGTGFEGRAIWSWHYMRTRLIMKTDIFDLIATHEGHKTIRDPVEKLYGKISTHEPQVQDCAKKFCSKLNHERDVDKPLNLSHACLSLALGMT